MSYYLCIDLHRDVFDNPFAILLCVPFLSGCRPAGWTDSQANRLFELNAITLRKTCPMEILLPPQRTRAEAARQSRLLNSYGATYSTYPDNRLRR